jgi:hypothetical protein
MDTLDVTEIAMEQVHICAAAALEPLVLLCIFTRSNSPAVHDRCIQIRHAKHVSPTHLVPLPSPNTHHTHNFMYLYRYVFFREYLAQHWRRYTRGRVILSDFRDVVFQRNPHVLPLRALHLSLESSRHDRLRSETVKGQPFTGAAHSATAGWMHLCYQDADVRAVYEEELSCSGVTWGGVLHVRMYLALMLREFVALQLTSIRGAAHGHSGSSSEGGGAGCLNSIGVDQGIHNMLLHNGTFSRYVRCRFIPLQLLL